MKLIYKVNKPYSRVLFIGGTRHVEVYVTLAFFRNDFNFPALNVLTMNFNDSGDLLQNLAFRI